MVDRHACGRPRLQWFHLELSLQFRYMSPVVTALSLVPNPHLDLDTCVSRRSRPIVLSVTLERHGPEKSRRSISPELVFTRKDHPLLNATSKATLYLHYEANASRLGLYICRGHGSRYVEKRNRPCGRAQVSHQTAEPTFLPSPSSSPNLPQSQSPGIAEQKTCLLKALRCSTMQGTRGTRGTSASSSPQWATHPISFGAMASSPPDGQSQPPDYPASIPTSALCPAFPPPYEQTQSSHRILKSGSTSPRKQNISTLDQSRPAKNVDLAV